MRKLVRGGAVVGGAAALLLPVLAAPAAAHVTANPDEADGRYATTWLRIGHGCDGSPTTEVRVQIPEGVPGARGETVTGWDVEIVEEDGRVTEVAWVGGHLPDTEFQQFGLSFQVTEDAGEVIWLPTIQLCEDGEHRWVEIPDSVDGWGALEEPAPYVINNTASGGDATDDADEDDAVQDAAGDEAAADDADSAAADSGGTSGVAVTALVVAIVGLLAAVGALVLGRRGAGAGS